MIYSISGELQKSYKLDETYVTHWLIDGLKVVGGSDCLTEWCVWFDKLDCCQIESSSYFFLCCPFFFFSLFAFSFSSVSFSPGSAIEAKIWGTGFVTLTKDLQFIATIDFEKPYQVKLKNPALSAPPACWSFIEPQLSADSTLEVRRWSGMRMCCIRFTIESE